jgi:2'-5' RNA ligase
LRAFFALPLPDTVSADIAEALGQVKNEFTEVKWVKKHALHITVQFLGDIDEEQLEECIELLKHPSLQRSPISVSYEGVGQFPHKGRPRVFYCMIHRGYEQCAAVYNEVSSLLPPSIKTDTKPFTPHITLGRVKQGVKPPYKDRIAEAFKGIAGEFLIDRIVLFESILKHQGAEYREVAAAQFR